MDDSQARNTLPFLRRSFLLGCAQNSTQPLPNHDFFSGLDGHGNEFDVVGLLAFFWVRLTLANRGQQPRMVRPEHLDHWISASYRGLRLTNCYSISAFRSSSKPLHCGPHSPLPSEKQ